LIICGNIVSQLLDKVLHRSCRYLVIYSLMSCEDD